MHYNNILPTEYNDSLWGGEDILSTIRQFEGQIKALKEGYKEVKDGNRDIKRQLQLARPSQRTAALLSSQATDNLLRRIISEMIWGTTLDVSRGSRNELNSAGHPIEVETAIEVWVPRGTTPLPYTPLRNDMITFTIVFGLCPTEYAKFARDDNLMNVFEANRALKTHSKLILNFAMDKSRPIRMTRCSRPYETHGSGVKKQYVGSGGMRSTTMK